jgi:23S rRNA pseudouridine1911/1915/1917 synthase
MACRQEEFRVVDECGDLLVVDKPAGLLVHPTRPGGPRTLWDGLRELLGYELANGGQVSLINRLDRETSGLVLVAKTQAAARQAAVAMQEGRIAKRYHAILCGHPAKTTWSVDRPIVRQGEVMPTDIHLKRMCHPEGAPAKTEFRLLRVFDFGEQKLALVEAVPLTGRTHQIRVHALESGHPVLGDKLYGPSEELYLRFIAGGWTAELEEKLVLPRHALHSSRLEILWNGEVRVWESPLPDDFQWLMRDA